MTRSHSRACLAALILFGGASGLACAGTIERDWPHSGNGSVTVDNSFGLVEVVGSAEPRVRLQGRLDTDAELVVDSASPDRLRLSVKLPDRDGAYRHDRGREGSTLQLRVPYGVALTVTGVSADIDVRGIRSSPMVAINTVSGDLRIAFNADAARLKSVSGDISVSGSAPRLAVTNVSGDVDMQYFTGGASASLVSGDFRIGESRLGVLDLESVSGDLEIDAVPLPDARWKLESLGGDIELRGLDFPHVAVSVKSFSGSIDSDTPDAPASSGSVATGGTRFRHAPPAAQAYIEIESFSGDVRLLRAR